MGKMRKMFAWTAALTLAFAMTAGVPFIDKADFGSPAAITAEAAEINASGQCGENVTYALDEDGVLTISGTGRMYHYELYNSPFTALTDVKKIVIEDGVTSIGTYAFYNCSSITGELVIGDSVTFIGSFAFDGCKGLTGELKIPDSVTYIGNYAFMDCSGLTGDLVLPEKLTSIGAATFARCSGLTGELVIPDSVTFIDGWAFEDCSGLTGDLIIPEGVTSIGQNSFWRCVGLTGKLVIPDSVTSIGKHAFSLCSGLTGDLVIPDSVTSIGEYAFYSCKGLTGDLVIPDSVTSIGEYAFGMCSGLSGKVTIPDFVTFIGADAFCGWKNTVTIHCYEDSAAHKYAVDNNIAYKLLSKEIVASGQCGENATYELDENGLFTISGTGAIYNYNSQESPFIALTDVKKIVIESGITSIGEYAFENCSGFTGNLVIPDSVEVIGDGAFYNCSGLTGNLAIPDSVEVIGDGAFYNCSGLTGDLAIPDSVISIGANAFYACSSLSGRIVISENTTSIGSSVFAGMNNIVICSMAGSYAQIFAEENGYKFVELEKLEITSQPVNYTGQIGDTVKFSIEAEGAKSYQWQQNTGTGWTNINASTGRCEFITLSLSEARLGYKYRCVVSNEISKIISDEVCMKLDEELAITKQPVNFTGRIGDTAKFTLEATGAVSCQWQQDTGKGWADINTNAARKNSISIVISQARLAYKYRCVISDGTNQIISNEVCMKLDEELAITKQPVNYTGKIGDTVKFAIEATGAVSYQWQQNTGKGWSDITTSAGRSKAITTAVSTARLAYKYRCVISDGTNEIISDEVCMKLDEELAITKQPANYTGRIGDMVKFAIEATGAVSYQWQQNTGKGWSDITTSAGRSKAITTAVSTARLAYKYRCVISDGTNQIISDEVCMKLDEELAITKQPVNYTGRIGDTVKFAIEATGAVSYQWQQNTGKGWSDITTSAGRSKAITTAVSTARLAYRYRCVISDGTNQIISNEVCMKLDEELAITQQPSDCIAEIGETVRFTVKATGATIYQWQVNNGKGWSDINTNAGRSSSITVQATAARNGFMYRCIVSDGTDSVTSSEVYLKV